MAADDDSSREELRRLAERLEHLEHVLQTQTECLYGIESHLGLDFQYSAQRRPPRRAETPPAHAAPPPPPPRETTRAPQAGSTRAPTETDAHVAEAPPVEGVTPAEEFTRVEDFTRDEEPAHGRAKEAPPPRPYESPYAGRDGAGVGSRGAGAAGGAGASGGTGGTIFGTAAAPKRRRTRDVESLVGGIWFNWVGILTVTFCVAFFLKYAFDNQWVVPAARVALGAAAGLGILVLAEFLRRRRLRQYAYVLSGGGLLILYLSVYAARAFYDLVSQPAAFLLMCGVTAAAVTLSVRHDALAIAILGLVGGFLTPVLLSTGQDNQLALFTYVALLDAGVLAVAYFKEWRLLNFLAFFATAAMTVGWMDKFYAREKLWPTVLFVTLFFLLFSALAPVHNILRRHLARWYDVLLIITNATFYFTLAYTLLDEGGYDHGLGLFTFSLSVFYAALFSLNWRRHREDRLLGYSYAGAAVTFLTTAVAVQFDQYWVTVAWATEGLMLVWVGLRAREPAARHSAIAVFAVAITHWFIWDVSDFGFVAGAADEFVPILNRRAFSCAALVAALLLAAWLYRRERAETADEERLTVSTFYVLAAAALNLTLLTLDLNDYFAQSLSRAPADDLLRQRAIENGRRFAVAALWTLYGAAALIAGLLRRIRLLRYGALLLLGAAALRVAWLGVTTYAAPWQTPFFNQTFLAFALLTAALALCARFYARTDYTPAAERETVAPVLLLLANLSALAALSLEAAGYFDREAATLPEIVRAADASNPSAILWQLESGKWFALSVVWCVYAAGAFWFGVRRRRGPWRFGALALLTVAAVKTISLDLGYYAAPWHAPLFNQTFGSFALLVGALVLAIYLYGRVDGVEEQERAAVPVLVVAANVLAIIALSAEARGHFESLLRAGELSDVARRDLHLAQGLSLSLVWAVYGGALLAYGHLRRSRLPRLMALALLGLTTLKVFFLDLSGLDRIYRIISFGVLGLILLAVSYLYQKSLRAAGEEDEEAERETEEMDEAEKI